MLRIVDVLPFLYLLGLLVIAVTPRNQRIGDLAASTLVVSNASRTGSTQASESAPAPAPETADALRDLAKLHADGILTDDEYEEKRRHLVERL